MAPDASMEGLALDKIILKDQVGGVKNRVTLVKVEGSSNTYDVYPDRTGVTQAGDEITAAALMQMQDNVEEAIGKAGGYDRVIPYKEGTHVALKVISAPVEPAPAQTAGLCVRVKMPIVFDETFLLSVSSWAAAITAEESVTGYTPVWPAGIYTFTYDGTAWRLPLPTAAGTAYTDLRTDLAITSSAQYTDNAVDTETIRAQQAETTLNHAVRRGYSPALHGTVSGEAVRIADSAAESDFSRLAALGKSQQIVTEQGKNLAEISDLTFTNQTVNGYSGVSGQNLLPILDMVKTYTYSAYIDNTLGAAIPYITFWAVRYGVNEKLTDTVTLIKIGKGEAGTASATLDCAAFDWTGVTALYCGVSIDASGEGVTVTVSNFQLEEGSAATDYEPFVPDSPSPDYPSPISGVQPASVRVCGKNLADESKAKWANITANPPTLLDKSAAVGSTLTISNTSERGIGVGVPVAPSAKYTVRMDGIAYVGNGSRLLQVGYYKSLNDVSDPMKAISRYSTNLTASDTSKIVSFTTPENCYAIVVAYAAYPVAVNDTIRVDHITVMGGTEAPFEPYAGTDYPLTLETPMYSLPGGTDEIDLVSGAETRRCGVYTFAGTETNLTLMTEKTNTCGVILSGVAPKPASAENNADRLLCSHLPSKTVGAIWMADTEGATVSAYSEIAIRLNKSHITGWSDTAASAEKLALIKAWLAAQAAAGTPVTVVYQLAAPTTTGHARADVAQPTPEANVSADGAPVDVTYSRDLQKAFDALSAAITASAVSPALIIGNTAPDTPDGVTYQD